MKITVEFEWREGEVSEKTTITVESDFFSVKEMPLHADILRKVAARGLEPEEAMDLLNQQIGVPQE